MQDKIGLIHTGFYCLLHLASLGLVLNLAEGTAGGIYTRILSFMLEYKRNIQGTLHFGELPGNDDSLAVASFKIGDDMEDTQILVYLIAWVLAVINTHIIISQIEHAQDTAHARLA
ncbi:hypothetical protein ACJX0J_035622 [Zea mays]